MDKKEQFMNKLKRLFSCFCLLALYVLSNTGMIAKANVINIPKVTAQNSFKSFYLYSGQSLNAETASTDNQKIADHYSHSSHMSHSSHRSHYSSSY